MINSILIDNITGLPCEHQFFLHQLLLGELLLLTAFQFFDSVSIPECVEGVLTGGITWGDVANHDSAAVADEGVLEHLSQLASAKGSVVLLEVDGPDAFLQGEQGLVDFCSVDPILKNSRLLV